MKIIEEVSSRIYTFKYLIVTLKKINEGRKHLSSFQTGMSLCDSMYNLIN